MKRSEEDIISRAPFKVRLGTFDYEVKPLGINPQRKWRELLGQELAPIVATFNQGVTEKSMVGGLAGALTQFPEKLTDLVFAYSPELRAQKETIMEEATEEQIAAAFSCIMSVAFPFLAPLSLMTEVIRASNQPSR